MGCEDVGWIRMPDSIFWQRPSLFWDVPRDRLLVGTGTGTAHTRKGHEGPRGDRGIALLFA